jgi:hypothetical protein
MASVMALVIARKIGFVPAAGDFECNGLWLLKNPVVLLVARENQHSSRTLLNLLTWDGALCCAGLRRTYGSIRIKRGGNKKRSEEAVHTIVASDWSEQ